MKYPLEKTLLRFPHRKEFYLVSFLIFGCLMLAVFNLGALIVGVFCGIAGVFVGVKKHSTLDALLEKITPKDKQGLIVIELEAKIEKLEKQLAEKD